MMLQLVLLRRMLLLVLVLVTALDVLVAGRRLEQAAAGREAGASGSAAVGRGARLVDRGAAAAGSRARAVLVREQQPRCGRRRCCIPPQGRGLELHLQARGGQHSLGRRKLRGKVRRRGRRWRLGRAAPLLLRWQQPSEGNAAAAALGAHACGLRRRGGSSASRELHVAGGGARWALR